MRGFAKSLLLALFCACMGISPALAQDAAPKFVFPDTAEGEHILPVDFHVHTVWSDGWVWPTVRVDEARQEGLAALALTDHVEFFRHAKYLVKDKNGLIDLNRSYFLAKDYAKGDVDIIHAAEITRGFGHYNCLFTTDNNKLRVAGRNDDAYGAYVKTDNAAYRDTVASITTAVDQGAFCLWNHPYAPGQHQSDRIVVEPLEEELIASGKIRGIEVANRGGIFYDAIDIAFEHNLTIIASSDVHAPNSQELTRLDLPHRTVTLVIASDASSASLHRALEQRRTVALFRNTLIGSQNNIATIVGAALRVTALPGKSNPERFDLASTYPLKIDNRSSVPMIVDLGRMIKPFDRPRVLTIPAFGSERIELIDSPGDSLKLRILNSVMKGGAMSEVDLPVIKTSD